MDDGNSWIGILLLAGAVVIYAILYGFGAAVQALNESALEDERDEGNKKAERLLHILENPYVFIRTNQAVSILIGILIGSLAFTRLAIRGSFFVTRWPKVPPSIAAVFAYAISIVFVTFLLICFGMVIPKRLAAKAPTRFCYGTLGIVKLFIAVFYPFTWLIETVSYALLKLVGIDIHAKDDNVTEEDIMYMVNEGHEQGVLEASEAEMITNIFEFDDKEAADIMTHRKNVVAIDGRMTLSQTLDFIVKEAVNSRFPVYDEDIDNIVGILHMRDVLYFAELKEYMDTPILEVEGLLREAHFIPETKNISALFKEMQSQKIHMEIIIDEYGQTAGIVTMEDILEEIVGNILDEYDEEELYIVEKGNGVFQLSGMAALEDVEDALGIEFEEDEKDNFDTLNGLLISRLGHLPEEDERAEVLIGAYRYKVIKVEKKIIKTVVALPVQERTEKEDDAQKA